MVADCQDLIGGNQGRNQRIVALERVVCYYGDNAVFLTEYVDKMTGTIKNRKQTNTDEYESD